MRRLAVVVLLATCFFSVAASAAPPVLLGYGVKPCDAFLRAADGWQDGVEADIAEYRRYQDWVSGFLSGLNLATGEDVTRGTSPESALRRIRLYCQEHLEADFMSGLADHLRILSEVERDVSLPPKKTN